jgi:hypothetical protein
MMDVMPSANYKKLLNDISNIQNSSDIIQENYDDDESDEQQLFDEIDEDDQSHHQESQEVALVLDRMKQMKSQSSG